MGLLLRRQSPWRRVAPRALTKQAFALPANAAIAPTRWTLRLARKSRGSEPTILALSSWCRCLAISRVAWAARPFLLRAILAARGSASRSGQNPVGSHLGTGTRCFALRRCGRVPTSTSSWHSRGNARGVSRMPTPWRLRGWATYATGPVRLAASWSSSIRKPRPRPRIRLGRRGCAHIKGALAWRVVSM
jgi:hypothetical protein